MKVLLINGSPHARGCTATALGVVADELQKAGMETEIIHVGHKDIRGCIGCYKCRGLGRCVFDNDPVNEVAKKFEDTGAWNLPVVDENHHYIGFISRSGLFKSYRETLIKFSKE